MKRVLVARLDNCGDVLLAGPAIRAVAAGAGHVTLLCGPRGVAAAGLLPRVDELLVHRAEWIDPEPNPLDPQAVERFVAQLGAGRFDEALVLTSYHQSPLPLALLLRMARVPVVAAISEDYPGSLLDVRHRVDDDIHEVERALSLVATLGYEPLPGDEGRLAVRGLPEENPVPPASRPYVVVHPGASATARAWAPARHEVLVAALARTGWNVVVTGAPGEEALTARVAGSAPGALDLGGRTDFATLGRVLADAAAVVVGNTGPAHLAAAVGTPVVSLFAPTVPAVRWRPWGVAHRLLGVQDIVCAGCRARECPVPGHPCLDSVPTARVIEAVAELADRRPAGLQVATS